MEEAVKRGGKKPTTTKAQKETKHANAVKHAQPNAVQQACSHAEARRGSIQVTLKPSGRHKSSQDA